MKVGCIIQARMGSERLPGKVLKMVAGRAIVQHLIDRAKTLGENAAIILATSLSRLDDPLERVAMRNGIHCHRGSETDVLGRFSSCAERFGLKTVIRLTADCPLLSSRLLKGSVRTYLRRFPTADYFFIDGYPNGLGAIEILSASALRQSSRVARRPEEREHVVPYVMRHPKRFRVTILRARGPLFRPDLRVCVDTPEDLLLVRKVAGSLGATDIEPLRLIRFLDRHPEVRALNAEVQQKQVSI